MNNDWLCWAKYLWNQLFCSEEEQSWCSSLLISVDRQLFSFWIITQPCQISCSVFVKHRPKILYDASEAILIYKQNTAYYTIWSKPLQWEKCCQVEYFFLLNSNYFFYIYLTNFLKVNLNLPHFVKA